MQWESEAVTMSIRFLANSTLLFASSAKGIATDVVVNARATEEPRIR